MFGIDFSELLVIGVVALVVIGPERLPKVARTAGYFLGRLQRYVAGVKSDLAREMELDELRKFKSEMEDTARSMTDSIRQEASLAEQEIKALEHRLSETIEDVSLSKNRDTQTADLFESPETIAEPTPQLELPLENNASLYRPNQ